MTLFKPKKPVWRKTKANRNPPTVFVDIVGVVRRAIATI
jgi:hypothetical protein